ncbi:hypothetical protein ARSQ2_01856 [Arsenophonus endosymbiont of Bemisia tabaci Q2]|nr:hypothetical protein ARSQ2_01856 [Arsenophonus endosymbiont of Bemisia tabaci Q2]
MRHRYFVRTQYGVIQIKSLSYIQQDMLAGSERKALTDKPEGV